MDKSQFESLMEQAELLKMVEPECSDFYKGYQRGLRRLYHGNSFGTEDEHILWFNIPNDDSDIIRQQRGSGYRRGFAGSPPK